MLIILFGPAGSGKNFIGDILAQDYGFYFWDADSALTPEMKQAIHHHQPFTDIMRDELTQSIIKEASQLKNHYPHLVISQALYKEKNRQQLLSAFNQAKFIYVTTDKKIMEQRIGARQNEVSQEYAKIISQYFEEPKTPAFIIYNNSDVSNIKKQLDAFFKAHYNASC
jgi:gluconate kinase